MVPYLREVGFVDMVPLKDFVFDNSLIMTFVERWRPDPHFSSVRQQGAQRKESFFLKLTWLRERFRKMSDTTDLDTLQQYMRDVMFCLRDLQCLNRRTISYAL
ncbi:hypothetical protein AHAS_Ahas14G0130400 [Arachis hypogaea]